MEHTTRASCFTPTPTVAFQSRLRCGIPRLGAIPPFQKRGLDGEVVHMAHAAAHILHSSRQLASTPTHQKQPMHSQEVHLACVPCTRSNRRKATTVKGACMAYPLFSENAAQRQERGASVPQTRPSPPAKDPSPGHRISPWGQTCEKHPKNRVTKL